MKNRILLIPVFLFYIAFFLYLLLIINPVLIFHYQQLGFSYTNSFLREFLGYPGGITEYMSLFLFQFSSHAIAGALLYTILAFLVVTLTRKLIPGELNKFTVLISYVPAVILAGLLTDYSFHLSFLVSVLIILCSLNILKLLTEKQWHIVFYLFSVLILFILTYYITGSFVFLVFSLAAVLYHIFKRKTKFILTAVILLVLSIALPFLASKALFYITPRDAFLKITPYYYHYKPGILLYVLYFYIPLIIFAVNLFLVLIDPLRLRQAPKKILPVILQFILIFVAGVMLCYFIFPKEQKNKILVDYYSYKGQWNKVLELAKENPSEDRLVHFHTNRALYHLGKLHEEMFDYPQTLGVDGLFLTRFFLPEILLPTTQLFIDLSYINEAIHWGNEAISQNENSPQLLEQLILSNIIARHYRSAQLYINLLKSNPVFRKTAVHYEQYIQGKSCPELDSLVKSKRILMPSEDFVVNRQSPQHDMINLLNNNKSNKMAFEYLMAYFLLKNDVASFIEYFPLGKIYHYPRLPKIFEEALALYVFELRKKGKVIPRLKLSKDAIIRFNDYLTILQSHDGNLQNARNDLRKKYGNTYWFYVHYLSPVTKKQTVVIK
ncbi:MAG: hypothetical protein JW973_14920 [Bacteroidales bacterium]|nr:hypothetical protein [Bacteroidales bacterium]